MHQLLKIVPLFRASFRCKVYLINTDRPGCAHINWTGWKISTNRDSITKACDGFHLCWDGFARVVPRAFVYLCIWRAN